MLPFAYCVYTLRLCSYTFYGFTLMKFLLILSYLPYLALYVFHFYQYVRSISMLQSQAKIALPEISILLIVI